MSSVDILVPDLPESVADATVATWHKKPGDAVTRDEVLVEIETDKVVLEVPASADGILDAVLEDEGTTVTSRQILGRLREGNSAGKESSAKSEEKASTPAQRQQASLEEQSNDALSPAIRRLLELVKRIMPEADEADLYWAYHNLSGALTLTLGETGRLDRLSGGLCQSGDLDSACDYMVRFAAAGFRAVCGSRRACWRPSSVCACILPADACWSSVTPG